MTDKLPDVWATRDFPVLVEVARQVEAGETMIRGDHVATTTGLPLEDVVLAARALTARGLVVTEDVTAEDTVPWFVGLSGEAYIATGLHPSGDDAVSSLVAALRQAADLADDPEEKTRLRALADAALGVGRNVLGAVLTTWLTAQIPN